MSLTNELICDEPNHDNSVYEHREYQHWGYY